MRFDHLYTQKNGVRVHFSHAEKWGQSAFFASSSAQQPNGYENGVSVHFLQVLPRSNPTAMKMGSVYIFCEFFRAATQQLHQVIPPLSIAHYTTVFIKVL